MRKINTYEFFISRTAADAPRRSGNKGQPLTKDCANGQVDPLLACLVTQAANHHVDPVQVRLAFMGKQAGMEIQFAAHFVAIAHQELDQAIFLLG